MKKIRKLLLLFCLIGFLNVRQVTAAANTLQDLKDELAALKKQKADNEASKNKTEAEINAEKENISNAHSAVEKAEQDILIAEEKIKESNEGINKTKQESEKLLVFYEIMQGQDNFAEYMSGASSMSDLMLRIDAISQILKYNQEKLETLENLIQTNKEMQLELAQKQQDLKNKINKYENSLSSLQNNLSSLVEVSLDINSQIKAQQELIEYYENIGCQNSDLLSVCVNVTDNSRWLRPTLKGTITSGFGYRSFYLNGKPYSDYHNAVDVGGLAGGTAVYAAANGTVAAVIKKAKCGGNQIFLHVRVNGEAYTVSYAHLLDVYVKVGDKVTSQDVIGTLGGGGKTLKKNGGWDTCSTGWHLHFGIAKGFYLGGGSEGYSSYSKFVAKSIAPPMMPTYGKKYYSRY